MASKGAANGGVDMYDGYKQDWVGGLTDKLVDGHEELAGFGEKRGAGAWKAWTCTGAGVRRARRRRNSVKGRRRSWALLLGCLLLCGKQGGDCVVGGPPCGVCFPHTVGATLLLAHPVGCSAVRLSI